MTAPTAAPWVLRCPVCATPLGDRTHPGTPCRTCGLPAAAHAGLVVGRIGATLAELHRDRDALLATLRGHATGPAARPTGPPPAHRVGSPPQAHPTAPPPAPGPRWAPPATPPPAPVRTAPPGPPVPPVGTRPSARPRRVSPQQVLVGLGSLLVVAAALALVAVAWTRFGIGFQAAVMGTVTAAAAAGSGWAARRGLRATEEGLAATAAALLVIDVSAARALGLLGLDDVDGLLYGALAAALVAVLAAALARATGSTLVWPAAALLAAQPVLPLAAGYAGGGALTVGALLGLAVADAAVAGRLPRWTAEVTRVLSGTAAAVAALRGTTLAWGGDLPQAVGATALLTAAAAGAAVLVVRRARRGRPLPVPLAAGLLAAVPVLAAAGLVLRVRPVAGPALALAGVALATAAVLVRRSPLARELTGGPAAVLVLVGTAQLVVADRPAALALVLLAGALPTAVAAVLVPPARPAGTAAALLLPGLAALAADAGGVLAAPATGLLLAGLAAAGLAVATLRTGHAEEVAAALTAPVLALAAVATGAVAGAWGQVAVQLAVVGGAALAHGVATRREAVRWLALADLVLAGWVATAGAAVGTPEAYSLPVAAALLAAAGPRLLRGPSWAGWGPGLLVGFAPSVLVAVAEDLGGGPVRVVLVLAAGVAAVVAGALTHRQAPFLVGAGALAVLGTAELAPVVSRLDSWVPLGLAGVLLLVVGATYEQRRRQAREAVAWVGQMG